MNSNAWELITTPRIKDDLSWELFHENSKATQHEPFLSDAAADFYARQMPESLTFTSCQEVKLPDRPVWLETPFSHAIMGRPIGTDLEPCSLPLETVAALLGHAYGTTGAEPPETYRKRRTVHSSGSLFPLEILMYSARVPGLMPGIYHFDPAGNKLHFLRGGDQSQKLAPALMNGRVAQNATLMFFITAVPERSVVRYGDRGYRFTLLEAGAVMQNLNLAAGALGLACVNVGEFFDRQVDEVLDLDGLTISTLYVVAVGKPAETQPVREGRQTKKM